MYDFLNAIGGMGFAILGAAPDKTCFKNALEALTLQG